MERPAKRARQACEPCRRKKSRCPGEKPICSFCARLKQPCRYSDDWDGSNRHGNGEQQAISAWEERVERLENKLDLVLNRILPCLPQESTRFLTPLEKEGGHSPPQIVRLSVEIPETSCLSQTRSFPQGISLPAPVIIALVETYIRRCDCQPLSIFDVDTLQRNIDTLAPEVLYSILALSLRFPQSPPLHNDPAQLAVEYSERARRTVMEKVTEGTVELSSLQALCLQTFFDLTAGNIQRAWLGIGIGMRLITSAKLNSEPQAPIDQAIISERRRCFWSFYILECLCSDINAGPLPLPHERPPFPPSLSLRSEDESHTVLQKYGDEAQDKGIIGYSLQLIELWKKTLHYVTNCSQSAEAPWSSGSGYFKIVASVMEWETYLCKNHRSAHARFSEQSSTGLLQNSRYWGPWLNVQFSYHGTLCLINHPFFLFSKTQSLGSAISTSFLESASDIALLHAKHIARLIVTLEEKEFEASDPFLGYCAAVASTTHLWYCHVEDRGVKEQAQARFATCYKFVARLGSKWPVAKKMATNLLHAKTLASAWKAAPEPPFTPLSIPASDMSSIWDLLSYPVRDMAQSTFYPSLNPILNLPLNPNPTSKQNSLPTSTQPNNFHTLDTSYASGGPGLVPYATPSYSASSGQEEALPHFVEELGTDLFNEAFNQSFPYEDGLNGWWNMGNL